MRKWYTIEKYFIKTENIYIIPYLLIVPDKTANLALLYLHPAGKSANANIGGEMEWFAYHGFMVLAPDLIDTGEMGPGDFRGDSYDDSVSYNLWFGSMLIGRTITGIRAGDIVMLAELLKETTGIKVIYGMAVKEFSPALLHAAAFNQILKRIALIQPYTSYESVVMNRFYKPEFEQSLVPGALKSQDLPDLAASLAPKKMLLFNVTDGAGKSIELEKNDDLETIRRAYYSKHAEGQLQIVYRIPSEKLDDLFLEWIK